MEEKKEPEGTCELFVVTDPRDGVRSYSLPWGQCPLDPAGVPQPPQRVNHPRWGEGVYDGVGDREGVLLYYFSVTDMSAEIGLDPSTLPQT